MSPLAAHILTTRRPRNTLACLKWPDQRGTYQRWGKRLGQRKRSIHPPTAAVERGAAAANPFAASEASAKNDSGHPFQSIYHVYKAATTRFKDQLANLIPAETFNWTLSTLF